jgi:hypothetical protein
MFNRFVQPMVSAYGFVVGVDVCMNNLCYTIRSDSESVLVYIEKYHLRMIYHQILLLPIGKIEGRINLIKKIIELHKNEHH